MVGKTRFLSSTSGEIRTHTVTVLSRMTLPLVYAGDSDARHENRTTK